MSLGAAFGSVFALDRQRARYESERVSAEEHEPQPTVTAPAELPEIDATGTATSSSTSGTADVESGGEAAAALPPAAPASRSSRRSHRSSRRSARPAETRTTEEDEDAESITEQAFAAEGDDGVGRLFGVATRPRENTISLAELEEQRELSRRRSSACVLLAVFVLFRLWIECLQTQDPTLLLLCLLGTSWTARWIRYNREREEELDRRIENYLQNNNNANEGVDRNEYARLSFQAQLALAIMESQRHMMEGGYGRPDGLEDQAPGVTDNAKAKWKQFHWRQALSSQKGDYGALPKGDDSEMDNHCSICLGEYEDDEALTQLPCHHVYHDECINSWTSNHTRCPLCNLDLESITGDNESIV